MDPNQPVGKNLNTNPEIPLTAENHIDKKKWNFSRLSFLFIQHRIIGETFGEKLAWSFCAGAIIANIISITGHFAIDYLGNSPSAKAVAILWLVSVLLAGISAILFSVSFQKTKKIKSIQHLLFKRIPQMFSGFILSVKTDFSKLNFWSLPHILILAFLIRVIPILKNGLYLDEWYWLETAKRILAGVLSSPFGYIGDQPSNLTAFPVAWLLALFKNPMLAVRLTGVIYSLIMITFLYLLIRNMIGKKAAAIGALLCAGSVWDIHMSNFGWNNVNINPMLVSGVLYFIYKIYVNKYSIWTLFALAFLLAVCLHLLYVATLLIIPVLITFLVLAISQVRNKSVPKMRDIFLFCLYFFICLSPLLPKLYKYPQESIGRHNVFVQQNVDLSKEANSPTSYYFEQMKMLAVDFSTGADNFRHQGLWGITLDPVVQFLSGLGILLAIIQAVRKKSTSYWLIVILSLCTLLLIPFVILYRTTSVWRAYAILPIIYLLATFSIVLISKFEKLVTQRYLLKRKGLTIFFLSVNILLYLVLSANWFTTYSGIYLTKFTNYETNVCQYASALIDRDIPVGSTVYIPDEMCFPLISILYESDQYHFVNLTQDNPTQILGGRSYLFILNSQRYGYFNESIQKRAEQIVAERKGELISEPSTTQPVLYLLN